MRKTVEYILNFMYNKYMNVYAISDLHLSFSEDKPMDIFGACWDNYWQKICDDWRQKVCNDDIVLIAGDISWAMTLNNALADIREIAKLPGKKVLIKGNHDYWWISLGKIRDAIPENFYVIQNDALKFGDYVIAGSRLWNVYSQSADDKKINAREAIRLEMSLNKASQLREQGDKLIVMCHYPPFDATFSKSVYTDIFEKFQADCVVYWHLHGKDCRAKNYLELNNIKYYLTSCDKVDNKLVKIY